MDFGNPAKKKRMKTEPPGDKPVILFFRKKQRLAAFFRILKPDSHHKRSNSEAGKKQNGDSKHGHGKMDFFANIKPPSGLHSFTIDLCKHAGRKTMVHHPSWRN